MGTGTDVGKTARIGARIVDPTPSIAIRACAGVSTVPCHDGSALIASSRRTRARWPACWYAVRKITTCAASSSVSGQFAAAQIAANSALSCGAICSGS